MMSASILLFGIIVHFHSRLISGIRRCSEYLKIKKAHLARLEIEWKDIPEPVVNFHPSEMSIEKDLDITGEQSLHKLIDTAVSIEGSEMLASSLRADPLPIDEILKRQSIIKELAEMQLRRDKFLLKAMLISKKPLNFRQMQRNISVINPAAIPGWLLKASSVLILAYTTLFLLHIIGIIPSYWILFFILYLLLYTSNQKKISKTAEESSKIESQLRKFSLLMEEIRRFRTKKNTSLQNFLENLFGSNNEVIDSLNEMRRISSAMLIRENPIMRLLLNLFFPFDLYFCRRLLVVIDNIKGEFSGWCASFSRLECYMSLSNFAALNEEYVFPAIDNNNNSSFSVKSMGHPLIKKSQKVTNDFSFCKEKEIVIITGSNMSGKSTFLKTVGINLCLAYAGAPVSAYSFSTSQFNLFTCIKISDSIIDGISYFYAEVKNLKQLLDKLIEPGKLLNLFLIDEIFKGTNNRERLIGGRAYIKELSRLGGTGFVSTHDLELVNLESEAAVISNYHFREEIMGEKMIFDYKIHPGPCPTTNALKIMSISGLPVE